MAGGRLALLVATFAVPIAGSAGAQTFIEERNAVATRAHHVALPFSTLTEMWAFGRRWSVNGFYAIPDRTLGRAETWHYVLRNAWEVRTHDMGGVRWADSRTCPALSAALLELESLSLARAEVPGLGAPVAPPPMDGASFTYVQRYGRDDGGAPVELEITGNVTTQLGMWWMSTDRALADCWTDQEPTR